MVDVFLQKRRDGAAAKRFFKRLLKTHRDEPRKIVTDKLRSYGVAHRELIPDTIHDTSQYANNRAELSHQPTRVRERGMRRFKSIDQAQRFIGVHSTVYTNSIWVVTWFLRRFIDYFDCVLLHPGRVQWFKMMITVRVFSDWKVNLSVP